MIIAIFQKRQGKFSGVTLSGHADFADYGSDIVCAAVTSALQLCANGITEVLEVDALVVVEENLISITLPKDAPSNAIAFLKALHLHLTALAEDYPDHIENVITEV